MEIVKLRLDEIRPYERNPRKNDQAVDDVAESIRQSGYRARIIVDENNVIIAGHTRYKALQKLGWTEAEVQRETDMTEQQKRKYRLLDNKVGEKSAWDLELLDWELEDLDFAGYDFGFDVFDVDEPYEDTTETTEDVAPDVPKKAKTKRGDVYQLGEHRVMCGDSTSAEDVAKLMDGQTAKVLFTSPPYADLREYEGGKDLEPEKLAQFIPTYKEYAAYQCVNIGIKRENHEIIPIWDDYIAAARSCGYKLMAWNVWDKGTGSIGQANAFFPLEHEFVFVFGNEFFEINLTIPKKPESIGEMKKKTQRKKDGTTSPHTTGDTTRAYKQLGSVLHEFGERRTYERSLHPATFPVALPAAYIKAMTRKGEVIVEPFAGSGTTLIACEQLGRKCAAMELEPKYVDVIIERWERETGRKAVLLP